MFVAVEDGDEIMVQGLERSHNFKDGVISEVRLGGVCGNARGCDLGPETTFGAVDRFE